MINQIKRLVSLRECVHIKALSGVGKTTLLRELENLGVGAYAEPTPLKPIIVALSGEKKGTVSELKELIDCDKSVLLLDDVHLITKQVKRFIHSMLNKGLVVVSIGSKNVFGFSELVLNEPSFSKAVSIVNGFIKNKELSRVIVSEVGTNPARFMKAVRRAMVRGDLRTVSGFSEFKDGINRLNERRELISHKTLVLAAGFLISLKYFFYVQGAFSNGYTAALIGYALMALSRLRK